jgi:hypothetical protein
VVRRSGWPLPAYVAQTLLSSASLAVKGREGFGRLTAVLRSIEGGGAPLRAGASAHMRAVFAAPSRRVNDQAVSRRHPVT